MSYFITPRLTFLRFIFIKKSHLEKLTLFQTSAGYQAPGPQNPVSSRVGGHAGAIGELTPTELPFQTNTVLPPFCCLSLPVLTVSTPGPGDVHEKLREKVSQRSGQVPISERAHQSSFTKGTAPRSLPDLTRSLLFDNE